MLRYAEDGAQDKIAISKERLDVRRLSRALAGECVPIWRRSCSSS